MIDFLYTIAFGLFGLSSYAAFADAVEANVLSCEAKSENFVSGVIIHFDEVFDYLDILFYPSNTQKAQIEIYGYRFYQSFDTVFSVTGALTRLAIESIYNTSFGGSSLWLKRTDPGRDAFWSGNLTLSGKEIPLNCDFIKNGLK